MKVRGNLNPSVKLIGVLLAVASFMLTFIGFTLELQAGQYTLYSQRIIIDSDAMIGNGSALDPTNFPLLLKLSDPLNPLFSYAQTDGDDIFFTDAAGERIDHEIVTYDASDTDGDGKEIIAWVRIPVLSSIANTDIFMYYGNPYAFNQENPEGVWDNNYVMVHHLDETSGQHLDSTANYNDSTVVNVTAQGQTGTAKIGGADEFSANKYVNIPDNNSLDLVENNGALTLSAWVYARSSGAEAAGVAGIITKTDGDAGYTLRIDGPNCSGFNNMVVTGSRSGNWRMVCSTNTLNINNWYYLSFTYDSLDPYNLNDDMRYIYINGDLNNSRNTPVEIDNSPTDLRIGEWGQVSFDGFIDEVRISNTARSADWIRAEYNNQNTPGSYIDFADGGMQNCADNDNDGYSPDGGKCGLIDCDDSNANVNPNATEICNGIDDNCGGQIDEGLTVGDYYRDDDGDNYGDPLNAIYDCAVPGYVADNTDCDDTDTLEHPNQAWYQDSDDDGYKDGTINTTSCERLSNHKVQSELASVLVDCNDSDSTINPGSSEIIYNGKDDDCNAATKDDDLDGDGYPEVTDCNDSDALVNPGFSEVHYNGKDDDCSSLTKDDNLDSDGYPNSADCNDSDPDAYPGAIEICDDKDNDCDGLTDEGTECWTKTGLSGGGKQYNITVDPLNPDIVYTTSDMIGAYKSIDKGEHWEWSNRDIYIDAYSIAFDPVDINPADGKSDTVYLTNPKGIFRSVDGGGTWNNVYSEGKSSGNQSTCTLTPYVCIYNKHQMHVGTDGTVYVPTLTGKVIVGSKHVTVWGGLDIVAPYIINGIVIPDEDGYVWGQLNIGATSEINGIVSPVAGVIVVATETDGIITYNMNIDPQTNLPYGVTGQLQRDNVRDIIMDPSNHNLLYALAGEETAWVVADFYTSENGGLTWTLKHSFTGWVYDKNGVIINTPIYLKTLKERYIGVNNSGRIFIIGHGSIHRSDDGGQSWSYSRFGATWPLGDYIFPQEDGDMFITSIAAGPDSNTWFLTTGSGVGRSDDNGNTWKWKVKGLRINGGLKCIEDPNNNNNIYCGLGDNQMIRSTNGGSTWTSEAWEHNPNDYWGDVQDLVFDPDDPSIVYALMLQSRTVFILCGKENTLGKWEWTEVYANRDWLSYDDSHGNIRFDPSDHNKIYVGLWLFAGSSVGVIEGVLDRINASVVWSWIGDGSNIDPAVNRGLPSNTAYSFMDIASNGNLYLGTDHELYKYNKNSGQWTFISSQGFRRGSFSIDPNNPNTLWAGGNYGAYKSTDGGTTWSFMTEGIGLGNYYVSATHTTESGVVFIAFGPGGGRLYPEQTPSVLALWGVWYSLDGGVSWAKFIDGMNDLRVKQFTSVKSPASNYQRIWLTSDTTPMYFQCTDSDSDGYAAEGGPCGEIDCNDSNPAIHPGATEICDGVDNDCDQQIDDDLTAPLNDLQAGVCSGSVKTCNGTGGWMNNYNSIANYESAEITCDALDNDCDDETDEGVQSTYYQDADSDTFGNLVVTSQACDVPAGYVTNNTDCDDSDALVNPSVAEIHYNGIDDDCNSSTLDKNIDAGFDPNANGTVRSIVVQSDGKILIGGLFTTIGGTTRNRIARLNADGSLDSTFNPNANNTVWFITVQKVGNEEKILIGGNFTTIGGITRNRIARLNANNSLDVDFNPNANNTVRSIAVQSDGKILVGGYFTAISGVTRNRIARLDLDGSLDSSFNPNSDHIIFFIKVLDDGKILVGGAFSYISGTSHYCCIARLNVDGNLDSSFSAIANQTVNSVALLESGDVLIGGTFTAINGTPHNRIARLHANGSVDAYFDLNANDYVLSLAVQGDGMILIGGDFTTINGIVRNRIARF
ncbi:MAG: DUF2341 domain-containing protein [Nitrospirota bacterium]